MSREVMEMNAGGLRCRWDHVTQLENFRFLELCKVLEIRKGFEHCLYCFWISREGQSYMNGVPEVFRFFFKLLSEDFGEC